MKYSSLEYSEFTLAVQPQFGNMKPKVDVSMGKEKHHSNEWLLR